MIETNDTVSLIRAVDQMKPPANYLLDTFFPTMEVSATDTVMMEYRKRGREKLAPYIIDGSRGVNVSRAVSTFRVYSPPTVAPRRLITHRDVTKRGFGEMPYFSTVSAEERQAKLQADDLIDLMGMIQNRKEQMASELLTTGAITIDGYADDGRLQRIDRIEYEWDGEVTITRSWDATNTSIFDCLQEMSERIQEDAGEIPPLLVVGKNVPGYLRKNKELYGWLSVPNRESMAMMSMVPEYISPQVQYIGTIGALGLTIVSYNATYTNEHGELQPYLGADEVIMGVPGLGSQQHAAIVKIDDNDRGFATYAAALVPSYTINKEANTLSLTMYSRFVLVPDVTGKYLHATVKV